MSPREQKREIGLIAAARAMAAWYDLNPAFVERVDGKLLDLATPAITLWGVAWTVAAKVFVYPGFTPDGPAGRFGLMTGIAKDTFAALAAHEDKHRGVLVVPVFVDCVSSGGQVYGSNIGSMGVGTFASLQGRKEMIPVDFMKAGREPNWLWPVPFFRWRSPMIVVEATALNALREPYTKDGEARLENAAEEAEEQRVAEHALAMAKTQGDMFT